MGSEQHRLLVIENTSYSQLDSMITAINYFFRTLNLPPEALQLNAIEYPPNKPAEFKSLVEEQTGGVLHNLDLRELRILREIFEGRPELAQRTVVVRNNGNVDEINAAFSVLESLGATLQIKPYNVYVEAAPIIFGVEKGPSFDE